MTITFAYYHDTNNITYRFSLYENEEAFAIGFGETCEEAKDNLRGWIEKGSETAKKEYRYDESRPYIALIKKNTDGNKVQTDKCINALEGKPGGTGDQITIRQFDF